MFALGKLMMAVPRKQTYLACLRIAGRSSPAVKSSRLELKSKLELSLSLEQRCLIPHHHCYSLGWSSETVGLESLTTPAKV
jgi:hypothetical protein